VVPGTPVLSGETVNLSTPAGTVASGTTDASGNYSITFTPSANATYSIGTAQITKIQNSSLTPVFGDLLSPSTTPVGTTSVQSTIKVSGVAKSYRRATVTGTVAPGTHANGVVTISGRKGGKGAFVNMAKAKITGASYSVVAKLSPGKWELQARFDDAGQVVSSVAPTVKVTVPGASSAKISRARANGHTLHVTGSVSPAPTTSGAYVRLLARHGSSGKYRALGAKVKIAKSRRAFTFDRRVSRSGRWQLRVEYVHKGKIDSSKSSTKKVSVS
jgi:hypothetical protein